MHAYASMYLCTHTSIRLHVYASIYACMHLRMHASTHACIYVFLNQRYFESRNHSEGEKMISHDMEVSNTLNSFFEHAVTLLGIPQVNDYLVDHKYILDPIEAIIRKYSIHPSVLNINKAIRKSTFNFKLCTLEDIQNEILNLKPNVSCPKGSLIIKSFQGQY